MVSTRSESQDSATPTEVLPVLYQDDYLIAIDKPAGLLVHRTKLDARETRFAMQLLRDQVGFRVYPIHRLDKPTSGVLLFGTSSENAQIISRVFAERTVRKTYRAVVRGWTPDEDHIDYPLKELLDRTTDGKAKVDKPAQEARTSFHTVARCELPSPVGRYETARYSLVDIHPETGRKNQIRRHFKHIFHPIVGDRKFGDRDHNAFFRDQLGCARMLLAATRLTLTHPVTNTPISITCPSGFEDTVASIFGPVRNEA